MATTKKAAKAEKNDRTNDIEQYASDIAVCKEIARELFPGVEPTPETANAILDAFPPLEDENSALVEKVKNVIGRCRDLGNDLFTEEALAAYFDEAAVPVAFALFDILPTEGGDIAVLDEDVVEETFAFVRKCSALVDDHLYREPFEGIFEVWSILPERDDGDKVLGKAAADALKALERCAVFAKAHLGDANFAFEVYERLPKDKIGRPVGDLEVFFADIREAKKVCARVHGVSHAELVLDVYDRLFAEE